MSGGGAQLTTRTATPLWTPSAVRLARAQGTLDLDEAIRREMAQEEFGEVLGTTKDEILHNKLEEMKYMKGKCEACGSGFSYDGRKHRTAPEKCSGCGGPPGSIPLKFDPPPEQEINVSAKKREKPDPAEDPRHAPEDYRPPIEPPNPLLDAFDRFQADCRKVFIARQKQHGKSSILDVTLEDLVGVHRLKGARIKQQVKMGVSYPEVFHDSLIDNAVYCFILWAVSTGEWEKLEWKEVA